MKPQLSVKIGSLSLKNPVMSASGTFGYGTEFSQFFNPSILGAVVLKGVSLDRVEGNPSPRIYETPSGMINAIGLQNVGLDDFIEQKVPALEKIDSVIVANVWGTSEDAYVEVSEKIGGLDVIDALEINISCPNIKKGGIEFGRNPKVAAELVGKIRNITKKPIWVKISPSAPDIGEMCRALEAVGTDVITLVNSIPAMCVDVDNRKPRIANVIGGLSGPAIRPIAVRMVYQAANAVKIPVVGIGGICTPRDALEFLIVGASAVQIGTAGFINPHVYELIIEGLESYLEDNGIKDINEIIGSLETGK